MEGLIWKIPQFYPIFKSVAAHLDCMDPEIESRLREAGEKLTEEHDEAVIADVIADVEELDEPTSDTTAELLRTMVSIQE